jgi:hypothetical protein
MFQLRDLLVGLPSSSWLTFLESPILAGILWLLALIMLVLVLLQKPWRKHKQPKEVSGTPPQVLPVPAPPVRSYGVDCQRQSVSVLLTVDLWDGQLNPEAPAYVVMVQGWLFVISQIAKNRLELEAPWADLLSEHERESVLCAVSMCDHPRIAMPQKYAMSMVSTIVVDVFQVVQSVRPRQLRSRERRIVNARVAELRDLEGWLKAQTGAHLPLSTDRWTRWNNKPTL